MRIAFVLVRARLFVAVAALVVMLPVAGCATPLPQNDGAPARADNGDDKALGDSVVLREVINGSYSAKLTFQPRHLSYVAELYHQGNVWRVIRTDVVKTAESTFDAFASQTRQLAQVEIDALRLHAGKLYAEHMVAINTERLQALQANLSRQRQESQQVMSQQNAVREQAQALSGDLRNVSAKLSDVQKNIRVLEAQQAAPELPIEPADPSGPATAPSTPSTVQ
jgi:hypothetical protein